MARPRASRRPIAPRPSAPSSIPTPARTTSTARADIFPLRYRTGGVLKRAGHTEATVDLCRSAGLSPAGVLCEIVTRDKSNMAGCPTSNASAKKHDLPLISIADIIRYRRQHEKLVRLVYKR